MQSHIVWFPKLLALSANHFLFIIRPLTFGRFYIWAKSTNLKPFDRYLLILGTEAQDGLKAWCDNNSWFCDCTDGGQLDDLFDDVGNFTEVNTGKIVLFC